MDDPLTKILAGAATGLLSGIFDNSDDVAQAQIDAANQGYAAQAAALEKQQALQKAMLLLQLMQQQQQGPLGFGAQLAGNQAGLDISTQLYNDQMRQDIPNRIAQLGAYPALGTMASMLGLPAYEFPTSFELSQIQTPNLMDMTKQGAAAAQPYFDFNPQQIAGLLNDPNGYLTSILTGQPMQTASSGAPVTSSSASVAPSAANPAGVPMPMGSSRGNDFSGGAGTIRRVDDRGQVQTGHSGITQVPSVGPQSYVGQPFQMNGRWMIQVQGLDGQANIVPYVPGVPASSAAMGGLPAGAPGSLGGMVATGQAPATSGQAGQPTIPSTVAPTARAPQTISLVPKQYEFDVTKTPGYQFRMDQAMKRADAQLAARGLSGSGVGMRFRADTSSDLAGKEFDKQLIRLQNYFNTAMGRSVSNPTATGAGIAGNVSQAGQNLSSAFNDAAKARTSAIGTTGTNLSSMIGTQGQLGASNAFNLGQINSTQAMQPSTLQRIIQGGLNGYMSSSDPFSNWRSIGG